MHAIFVIMLRYPILGAVAMSLGGSFFTYIWYSDQQDPRAEHALGVCFPIAFWVIAAMFAAGAFYRKNQVRFSKPVSQQDVRPLSSEATFFTLGRTDGYGTTTHYILLLASESLRVWKLSPGKAARVTEAFGQGLCPHADPAPTFNIPFAQLHRVCKLTDSTLSIEYRDNDGQEQSKRLDVKLESGEFLSSLTSHGWLFQTEPDSRDLLLYEFRQNLVVGVLMGLVGAVAATAALFPNPLALLIAPTLIAVGVGAAWLAAKSGPKDLNFVFPPTNARALGRAAVQRSAAISVASLDHV